MADIFSFIIENWPVLILTSAIAIYLWFYIKNYRFNRLLALIPGPPAKYPLLGNIDLFMTDKSDPFVNVVHDTIVKVAENYSEYGIFKLKLGLTPKVFIFRKDMFEVLLKDQYNINKGSDYQLAKDWLGKGLAINEDSWRERRNLLMPAFHKKIIEEFIPVVNEKTDIFIDNLSELLDKESIDICPYIDQLALDIVSETTMGFKMNSQQKQNLNILESTERLIETLMERFFKPWFRYDWIFYRTKTGKQWLTDVKTIDDLTRKKINERKQYFMENKDLIENKKKNNEKLVLLDLLLDKHLIEKSLTFEDVCAEVKTFMFAGHETFAKTLTWSFYLIGLYPQIQQRLYEELTSIVSKNEEISKQHINQMKYLEAVLNESMRVYPVAHFIMRQISRETKLGNYIIPVGTEVNLAISVIHMDPQVFPEPTVFNPDRFLGENSVKNENTFSFIPFSAGPRNCIGQKLALNELKIILSKTLINYRLESMDSRDQMKVIYAGTAKPMNGLRMKILPR